MSGEWATFFAVIFFGLAIVERLNVIAGRLRDLNTVTLNWAERAQGERDPPRTL
jgi:hypothetical protein